MSSTNTPPTGDTMQIARGYPFPVDGVRLRTGARTIHDPATLVLRIGPAGESATIEQALSLDDSDATDPFWWVTITDAQTALLTETAYRYVFVDDDDLPVLEGAVVVRALPMAAA